ncbi:MAG TPA: SCO family protein [Terriglobales bacterium]|jgi:protein SCO1/2
MDRRSLLTTLSLAPLALVGGAPKLAAASRGPRANYFPNVTLYNQFGKKVKFYDDVIAGKLVTVNFFFADCNNICPRMTSNLVKVQKLLGKKVGTEIFMNSLTLSPQTDTPEVLKEYADMHGVGPGWQFLTAHPEDMEKLRRKLGFVDPDPQVDKDREQHIGVVLYGNERYDRWAGCPAITKPQEIVQYIGWLADPPKAKAA